MLVFKLTSNENFLLKLRSQLIFLKDSKLSTYIDFSPVSDPFLIYPIKNM